MRIVVYVILISIMQSMVSCYAIKQKFASKHQPFKPHHETKPHHKKHH